MQPGREPWYQLAVTIFKPLMWLLFSWEFRGQAKIPATGGAIVAANHTSHADPFAVALFVHNGGRRPRFMAKKSVFRIPLLGRIVRGIHTIPVDRHTADAHLALAAAVEAVKAGEVVVLYPEGTVTRDPDLWPMRCKTGAARLALETGAPVIPLGHWGVQEFLCRGRFQPFPRKRLRIVAGDPVSLEAWRDRPLTAETLQQCTAAITTALTGIVAELRGETPPAVPFDPRAATAAAEQPAAPDDDTRRSA